MRLLLTSCLLAFSLGGSLVAADDDAANAAIAEFNDALSGSDLGAKRAALSAVTALGKDYEVQVLEALQRGAQDRQLQRHALQAFISRTGARGLSSGARMDANLRAMSTYIAEAKRTAEIESQVSELAAENERLTEQVEGGGTTEAGTSAPAATDPENTVAVGRVTHGGSSARAEEQAGQLDRILFNDGGMLLAYIVSKRVDLDGNLTSIRIMHRDGAGEETLDAHLISRIEEDIR